MADNQPLKPDAYERKMIKGLPNLFVLYPQIIDIISCACLMICMILWMPYYIQQDKGFNYSIAMNIFWVSDIFTIAGCVLTIFSIWKPEKMVQLTAILLLFIGAITCLIAGAIDSDDWCRDVSIGNVYLGQCITYIIFMYCLFVPFSIGYVILLILYRSQYTFSNVIFMRSKRIMYLMFVGGLMIVPVIIMLEWYYDQVDWEFRSYWISVILLDVFTWLIALIYGFQKRKMKKKRKNQNINNEQKEYQSRGVGFNHPLCISCVVIIWIITFIMTLLFGFVGYSSYDYNTDDLLARYADYILMVSVNLWLIGELLGEDEGYIDIDFDVNYASIAQDNDANYDDPSLLGTTHDPIAL